MFYQKLASFLRKIISCYKISLYFFYSIAFSFSQETISWILKITRVFLIPCIVVALWPETLSEHKWLSVGLFYTILTIFINYWYPKLRKYKHSCAIPMVNCNQLSKKIKNCEYLAKQTSEVVVRRCFPVEKVFLKFLENSQENTCAESLFINVASLRLY